MMGKIEACTIRDELNDLNLQHNSRRFKMSLIYSIYSIEVNTMVSLTEISVLFSRYTKNRSLNLELNVLKSSTQISGF